MRRRSSRKPEPTIKRSNMQQMPAPAPDGFIEAAIPDVIVRDLRKFTDSRGWLTELFRRDDVAPEFSPAMAYISSSLPGVTRGTHVHVDYAVIVSFLGRCD